MDVNYKFNREEENVVVSNNYGIMDIREYQDNIEDVLILKDVIEGLNYILFEMETVYNSKVQDLEDIDAKIEKKKKDCIKFCMYFLISVLGAPILMRFVRGFKYDESFIQIIQNFFSLSWSDIIYAEKIGCCVSALACILDIDLNPFKTRSLKVKKMKKQSEIKDLNLEIFLWKQHIAELEDRLNYLLEKKEKNNLENMSTEVKTISYKETLEREKTYLIQMYQDNCKKMQEPENKSATDMILGRFKKRKEGN